MVKVTLDIFSGRQNPSWILSEEDAKNLMTRFAGKAMPSIDSVEKILGFRSFIIEAESDDEELVRKLPSTFRVGGYLPEKFVAKEGIALPALASDESKEAAHWLLTTAGKMIDEELIRHVESVVETREKAMGRIKEEPIKVEGESAEDRARAKRTGCVIQNTPYNPGLWNDDPYVLEKNNCYNYAMNHRSDTFAQPGRISGHPNSIMECAEVIKAAELDGCKRVCSGSNKNVALVVWPGQDFHWFRKQSDGFWAHKAGNTIVRNMDNCGYTIDGINRTPENCCREPYTHFCGYMYSPTGMKVR